MGSAENSIFEQYNAALAREVVEQLRPLIESLAHPATGVQKRLFTIDEAAIYLGRTPLALRLLIQRGKIPVTKIDSKVQLDRAVLDKLIGDSTFFNC